MSLENSIRLIREVHPSTVILVRLGKFYQCFSKDAYIVSYIFDYKLKKDKYVSCGFPLSALNKVKVRLEHEKIDYIVVDKRLDYEVLGKEQFEKENKYEETYAIAKNQYILKERIGKINKYLVDNLSNVEVVNKIKALEKLLYEEWAI